MIQRQFIGLLLLSLVTSSCRDPEVTIVRPQLVTHAPISVTTVSAVLSGEIITTGSLPLLERGFFWSKGEPATETSTKINLGSLDQAGEFRATLSVERGQIYYYRAYAKTEAAISLGNQILFGAETHVITSVTPTQGIPGTSVTISGSSFSGGTHVEVRFGSAIVVVTPLSDSEIHVDVPVAAAGIKDLVVAIENVPAIASSKFTIVPAFEDVSPTSEYHGGKVDLAGAGFSPVATENDVRIGGIPAMVESSTTTTLRIVVPDAASLEENQITLSVNGIPATTAKDFFLIGWQHLADLTAPERAGQVHFAIGTKLYYGLGINFVNQTFTDFWSVDLTTGVEAQLSDFPGNAKIDAVGFSIGGKGYVALGNSVSSQGENAEVWEYDPNADSWTPKATYPGGVNRAGHAAFVLNDKIYVGNGEINGVHQTDFNVYDPISNSWSPATAFSGIGISNQGTMVLNNNAILVGGTRTTPAGTVVLSEVWSFDGVTWGFKSPFPGLPVFSGNGFPNGLFGFGQDDNHAYNNNWLYALGTDSWRALPNFPGQSRRSPVAGSANGIFYFGLGYGASLYADLWIMRFPP